MNASLDLNKSRAAPASAVQTPTRVFARIYSKLTISTSSSLLLHIHVSFAYPKRSRGATPYFTPGSTADKNFIEVEFQYTLPTKRGHCYSGIHLARRSRVKREKVRAPWRQNAFFDRTAERGITLPNEQQIESRGISLCSGCIVAWHILRGSLWGPGAQSLQ